MDPFDQFAEQQESYELIGEHRDMLLAEAREVWGQAPQAEVVGLIVAPGAAGDPVRGFLEQATGQNLAGRGITGLVPRELVVAMLRAQAPATLEWLPPSRTADGRSLPIAAVTAHGFRFAAVSCPE